jgi:serine/threonine-protein kinase
MSMRSSGTLIDALREHALLRPEQLTQIPRLADGRCGDARALAKILVQRGLLTVYQMNQLLLEKAGELVIGPYHILDRLGHGGLSAVYKARHARHDWIVALKVIQPEVIAADEGRRQFLLEMEAMVRLDHPNIVQFCDTDQVGDTVYYAMEFIEGTDLGKYVRLTGCLPVAEACDYIRQSALGLQHALERNLVHRDIKPVNLYLTHPTVAARQPAGRVSISDPKPRAKGPALVKILDWGLASLRSPRGLRVPVMAENLAKGVIGTADYLSPEQARNAQAVDIRGDIYSLGCTFYYLLTGQAPFPEGTLMQKLMQHQSVEPAGVGQFREDVPSEVVLILKRMMAKRPESRFQTPAAVALALLPFARNVESALKPRLVKRTPAPTGGVTDETPLPTALGGVPGTAPTRLPKAGRASKTDMDTSSP